jgi:hypothetical protein
MVCNSYTVLVPHGARQSEPAPHPKVRWSKVAEDRYVSRWLVTVAIDAARVFEQTMESLENNDLVSDWWRH